MLNVTVIFEVIVKNSLGQPPMKNCFSYSEIVFIKQFYIKLGTGVRKIWMSRICKENSCGFLRAGYLRRVGLSKQIAYYHANMGNIIVLKLCKCIWNRMPEWFFCLNLDPCFAKK